MPSVCDCPYCGQPTAIPGDMDSDTVVRCPLCHYEFPGDRALMYAVEAPPEHIAELPPALIPVGSAEDAAPEESKEESELAAQDPNDVASSAVDVVQEAARGTEPSQTAVGEPAPAAPMSPPPATDPSPASDSPNANATQPAPLIEHKPPGAAQSLPAPVSTETTPSPSFCQSSPAWRERRNRNPVRTAIGIVLSGLLGLAVPYGAWVGLSKLGVLGGAKPSAAETEDSGQAKSESAQTRPPEPKSFDEWPGLDENRFAGPPREVSQNVQPARPAKKRSGGSGK